MTQETYKTINFEELYYGCGKDIFYVKNEYGETVDIEFLNYDKKLNVEKEKLESYSKNNVAVIGKYIEMFEKDYPYLLIDLSCNISLSNIPVNEFNEIDIEIYKKYNGDRDMLVEKLKEHRKKHLKMILLNNFDKKNELITNDIIIGNELTKDLISSFGLVFLYKKVTPEFISSILISLDSIKKVINKFV